MVHNLIIEESKKPNGYSKSACFRMIGVSSTGYYDWKAKYEDKDGSRAKKEIKLNKIKEKFRKIIKKLGFIPGKRTFRLHMWRNYEISISVKKCAKIMKSMHLVPNLPKKDAYKGQATHFHECCAKYNFVAQDFKIGPRKVILTDITYLYYGSNRVPCYLCVFKDAFTNEVLGYHVDTRMTVELVKVAYDMMMKKHKNEIKTKECYLHSDQGSQYLSTEFQTILNDDEFIQSMSNRGNSQDNAPMESFFGRMKCEAIDIIALCSDIDTVKRLIDGYMDTYNNKRYQYPLAGLTPSEFYIYATTGVYPLDNYYGVESTDLLSVNDLVLARLEKAKEKSKRTRIISQNNREEKALLTNPASVIARDQKLLKKELKKWNKSKEIAEKQIKKINEIYNKTIEAIAFYTSCTDKIKESLRNLQNWKNYSKLDYVNEIADLY